MSIKRYDSQKFIAGMFVIAEKSDGKYVLHSDYAALEQQLVESQREFRSADATIENLQMQVEKLAAENAGMDAFVDALLSIVWQGGSADGAEIQEMTLKHGLLRQEVYSADEHENLVDDPGNFEDGDPVYFRVETPATDAFLAEVRAQGVEMLRKDPAIKLCSLTHVCDEFAAQLRQEAK